VQQAASHQGKYVALFVATISTFLTPFLGSSISVALPTIGRDFHMDAVTLSWVSTAYLLAAAVALVPAGRIADIHGRKRIWLYGVVLYTLFSVLCAAAPDGAWLIAFRALQAVGSTLIYGTGLAILTSVFPREERGRVIGFNVAAVYTGLSIGPFVGGLLTDHWGWRSIFLATVPIGLLAIFLIVTRLKGEWAEARGERFDVVGAAIYGLALVALTYGLSGLPSATGALLAVAGLAGLAVFTWWELRTDDPVLEVRLFRDNLVFALSNLAALINYGATVAVTFLLSLYLQYVQGLSPAAAGAVLVSQPVVMMLVSLVAGRLADRVEPRIVVSLGMALTAAGLLAFYARVRRGGARPAGRRLRPLLVAQRHRRHELRAAPLLRRRLRHPEHHARHGPDGRHGADDGRALALHRPGARQRGQPARLPRRRADRLPALRRPLRGRRSRLPRPRQSPRPRARARPRPRRLT
jgi:EmrB/QacA subfamily drug resistance transporter